MEDKNTLYNKEVLKLAQEFGEFTITDPNGKKILLANAETSELINKVVEGLKNGTVRGSN
jgi:uncharacterized protein YlzI (FlbEa/FlbD family)